MYHGDAVARQLIDCCNLKVRHILVINNVPLLLFPASAKSRAGSCYAGPLTSRCFRMLLSYRCSNSLPKATPLYTLCTSPSLQPSTGVSVGEDGGCWTWRGLMVVDTDRQMACSVAPPSLLTAWGGGSVACVLLSPAPHSGKRALTL